MTERYATEPSTTQLSRTFDTEARRRELTRAPEQRWREPDVNRILAYTLVVEHDPALRPVLQRIIGHDPIIDLRHRGPTEILVQQNDGVRRLEARSLGVFGRNCAYVLDPRQGLLFLDLTDQLFLHIPEGLRVRSDPGNVSASVIVEETESSPSAEGRRAVIEFTHPVRARVVLWLDPRQDLRPHSAAIFETLFACGTPLESQGLDCRELIAAGIPVRGEAHIEQAPGDYRLASWFSLEDVRLEDYVGEMFGVPASYKDLRNSKREAEDGYSYGGPRRWSMLRPARRSRAREARPPKQPSTMQALPAPDGAATIAMNHESSIASPRCYPSTYGSQLGNLVDQTLLDDIRYVVNGVSRRLTGFDGAGGVIDIDWLAQLEEHANALNGGPGSGLFFLLRDPSGDGEGLLDAMSEVGARRLLVNGALGDLTVPAGLLAAVDAVITDGVVAPEDRFDTLSPTNQQALREAYLEQRIARVKLKYPETTPTTSVFHDLLKVKLLDIKFDVNMDNTSIVSTLKFADDHVYLRCDLPGVTGSAWVGRWPTDKLWAILGVSALGCLVFPPACLLAGAASAVVAFLALDFAAVKVELDDIEIDAEVRFTPNANNVLQPDVALSLDAEVDVRYISVVPTGVHQILSLIYTIVADHLDVVIDSIEDQLRSGLNRLLRDDLAVAYPPQFGPVPLIALSNAASFDANDRMIVTTGLNAGLLGVTSPFITQVDDEIEAHLVAMRDDFKQQFTDPVTRYQEAGSALAWLDVDFDEVARYYFGSVISQNFINHYVHTLWRDGALAYTLSQSEASDVLDLLAMSFPQLGGHRAGQRRQVRVWPSVSPRVMFTPLAAAAGGAYALTFFDDVRLCAEFIGNDRELRRIEFLYAAQLNTQIGFGGVDRATNHLDLSKVATRLFDLYFDLDRSGVTLITPDVYAFRSRSSTLADPGDFFRLNANETRQALSLALSFALASRNDAVIPAHDNTPHLHRYNIGSGAFQMVAKLVPFSQNLYVSFGTSGLATAAYEGALDIDKMSRPTALLIRAVAG